MSHMAFEVEWGATYMTYQDSISPPSGITYESYVLVDLIT
jgi:hypothetical protein